MEGIWQLVGLAVAGGGIAYGLMKAEAYYRNKKVRKWLMNRPDSPPPPPDYSMVGTIQGAAESKKCGNCGVKSRQLVAYRDGDFWCRSCHDTVEAP